MSNIIKAEYKDIEILSKIVSESNKDVAIEFGLNFENAPAHPSFYTKQRVEEDFNKGEVYFIYKENSFFMGCVAFEHPRADTAYLNRLAVLPKYRHNKVGEKLVNFILEYAKTKNIQKVSIGIIAEHELLKKWYLKLGFVEVSTKSFEHLPFNVTYMKYEFKKEVE